MRKTIKLAVVAALALGATSAFATNGDNLIATGAKARAMGGVGVATSFGAESALANPALLSTVKSSEFSGSVTAFMPDVSIKGNYGGAGAFTDSDADFSLIPEIAYASRIDANLVYGVSVTGTAGMGVDLDNKNTPMAAQMTSELALMKVSIPVSYQMGELALGFAPILQYGTLMVKNMAVPSGPEDSDTGFGYELGLSYEVDKGVTIGAVYKSEIAMTYKNVLSQSINAFGAGPGTTNTTAPIMSGDKLDQPAEYGVGVSYVSGANTIAADYRRVEWGSATGYADFAWDDQDIFSIGYEYATKGWALRAGYNYAKSPISEQSVTGTAQYTAAVQNFFNLSGFPGVVESHYTFGGGYNMSDDLSIDCAVVYAAEEKNTYNTNAGLGADASVVHSQLGVTVGATYKF